MHEAFLSALFASLTFFPNLIWIQISNSWLHGYVGSYLEPPTSNLCIINEILVEFNTQFFWCWFKLNLLYRLHTHLSANGPFYYPNYIAICIYQNLLTQWYFVMQWVLKIIHFMGLRSIAFRSIRASLCNIRLGSILLTFKSWIMKPKYKMCSRKWQVQLHNLYEILYSTLYQLHNSSWNLCNRYIKGRIQSKKISF